jgi:hypothetical protein
LQFKARVTGIETITATMIGIAVATTDQVKHRLCRAHQTTCNGTIVQLTHGVAC